MTPESGSQDTAVPAAGGRPEGIEADAGDELPVEDLQGDQDEEDWVLGPARWVPWVTFALSLVGLGISIYLTYDHFTGTLPVCSDKGFVNCQAVTTSPESYFIGIPVALLGLFFYSAMTIINFPLIWKLRHRWLDWIRVLMAVSGIGFVFHLLYAELFDVKAICLWCSGVHITTFILFVVIVLTAPSILSRADSYDWDDEAEN